MTTWDPTQRAVLEHDGGPLLVVGSAGTGKTSLMVELVAKRMGGDQSPALGLCLTRQAASEVRDKVIRASGRTSLQPSVMTLHALCLSLLQRYVEPMPQLLTAPEQEFRVREVLALRGASAWPDDMRDAVGTRSFARQIRGALARARQLGLDPEALMAMGERAGDPAWVSLGEFFEAYLDVLDAEGVLDYAELVHRTRLLLADPAIADAVRADYGALVIDEAAELDPAQWGLVRALMPTSRDIVAFADPDTAIFRFRGAHPRPVAAFDQLFGGEVVTLGVRHGLPSAVDVASRGVAARLPLSAPVSLAARTPQPRDDRGRVDVLTFATEVDQAVSIATELRAAHLEQGLAWSDMAVLVRSGRQQIPPLARALTDAGIPVDVAGDEMGLADELAVRPLLLALSCATRESCDADETVRLLTSGWGGLDAVSIRTLGRILRGASPEASQRTSAELITDAFNGGSLPETDEERPRAALSILASRRDVLARARAQVADGGRAEDVLWTLWSGVPWPQDLRQTALSGSDSAPRADHDLDAVVALFTLARESTVAGGARGVRAFLDEVGQFEIPADVERESAVRGRGVRVLTAHRAKGKCWRLVVVSGVQEGVWPDVRRRGSLFDPERLSTSELGPGVSTRDLVSTERRLFLLACTRASERLVVTAVDGTEGEADQPSRFLAELGVPARAITVGEQRLVTLRALVASLRRTASDPEASPELRSAAATRLAALASEVDETGRPLVPDADPERWWGLREPTSWGVDRSSGQVTLSPSQLSDLLACPRSYFLKRDAHAEPPRSSSAVLGSVIHALAEHSLSDGLSLDDALARLDDVWESIPFQAPWFSASERTAAEQAVVRFMGWQAAHEHADVIGVEVPFSVDVPVDDGSVRISGSIDRLERDADGGLRVIDFKSARRPPTVAEAAASDQLGVYQLAIEQGALPGGSHAAGGQLVYLRHGTDDYPKVFEQPPLSTTPHLSDDPEEAGYPTWVHHRLSQARSVLVRGRFDATPGAQCQFCAFSSSCPVTSDQVIR